MTNAARHDHLRQIASVLRRRADVRDRSIPPHLRPQRDHLTRLADQVQVLLRLPALPHELLELTETVLRGLEQQLRDFEDAVAAHAVRQTRFLQQLEEGSLPQGTNPNGT